MKKRSVVLVMFQEPISSSWAFIYTFVMLIEKNCLSHPGFDTYSSICWGPGVPPFSHAKSPLPGRWGGVVSCTAVQVPQQGA